MILTLTRKWREGDATIGEIAVDGGFECYSLEDRVHDGPKIPGQTAIPTGAYGIVLHTSAALRMEVPMLCDVPDFDYIYLPPGNTPSDTKGCIPVGRGRDVAAITDRAALPVQRVSTSTTPEVCPAGWTGSQPGVGGPGAMALALPVMHDGCEGATGSPRARTRRDRRPEGRRSLRRTGSSESANVVGFVALAAGADVELDLLTFVEGLEALAGDVREVDEHVVAVLAGDEAEALLSVEELHSACSQNNLFSQ